MADMDDRKLTVYDESDGKTSRPVGTITLQDGAMVFTNPAHRDLVSKFMLDRSKTETQVFDELHAQPWSNGWASIAR